MILIYYFKSFLPISDIQTFLKPIIDNFFKCEGDYDLSNVYNEIVSLEMKSVDGIKKELEDIYTQAGETFGDAPEEYKELLHNFAFVCMLGTDVYVKKLIIEKIIDVSFNTKKCEDDKEQVKTDNEPTQNV